MTAVIKNFKFGQNFDSISNFQKSFKSTKEHLRIPCADSRFIYKSDMRIFKIWPKSEILLMTAVMKNFNFTQNFVFTSNFNKCFKTTKEHFRISFGDS